MKSLAEPGDVPFSAALTVATRFDVLTPFRLTVVMPAPLAATPLMVGVMVNSPLSCSPSVNWILAAVGVFSVAALDRVRLTMSSVAVAYGVSATFSVPVPLL